MAKKPGSITISLDQARDLRDVFHVQLQGAGLHQVLGPHYKEIIYIEHGSGKKPFISKSHTIGQIKQMLQQTIPSTTTVKSSSRILARLLPLIADDIPITLAIRDKINKLGYHTKIVEMDSLFTEEELADKNKVKNEIIEATLGFIKAAIIVWQNKRIYAEIGVGRNSDNYRLASRRADLSTILKILRAVQPLQQTYEAAKNKLQNLQAEIKWVARATPVEMTAELTPITYDGKVVGYLPKNKLDEFVKSAKQIKYRQMLAALPEHDGNKYFKLDDLAEVKNAKSRQTLVYMSPDDFLLMAKQGLSADKSALVYKLVHEHTVFDSTPYLSFVHDGKGMAQVIGHEGRHRARALKAIGVKQIPVVLNSVAGKGQAIRWGSQDNAMDKVAVLPSKMRGEDKRGTIAMPQSVIFPIKTGVVAADVVNAVPYDDRHHGYVTPAYNPHNNLLIQAKCGGPGCCATCGAEWQSKYGMPYPEKKVIVARPMAIATAGELNEKLAALYAEYNTGKPLISVAAEHRTTPKLLKQLFEATYGANWRDARQFNSAKAAQILPMLATLYQQYIEGKSLTRLASEQGVSDVLMSKLFTKTYGKKWYADRKPRKQYQPEHLKKGAIIAARTAKSTINPATAHSDNHSKRVADLIVQQMGGTGRLAAMLGAKNFVRLQSGLQFDISSRGSKNKANRVVITYEPGSDEYTMIFYRLRNLDLQIVSRHPHLQVAQLQPTFTQETGLATHL
jgi:hypothetical protein